VDLGWRLWLGGRRVRYEPFATVCHHYGGTGGGRESGLRLYHCQKNRLANATKNLSLPGLAGALAAGFIYDTVRIGAAFRRGRGLATVAALTRGTAAYLRWLPGLLRERRRIQRMRVRSDGELRAAGAIAGWRASFAAYRTASHYREGGS
jgi:GT2 family glycosyltransferase